VQERSERILGCTLTALRKKARMSIRCCWADKVKPEDKAGEAKHAVYFPQKIRFQTAASL